MNTERIQAAKHFGLDQSRLRTTALKLALWEMQMREECRDMVKVDRILHRWKLRDAFSFYCARPELF